jgi:YHS domain-containing protein
MRLIALAAAVVLSTGVPGCGLFRGSEEPLREDQAIDPVTGWRVSKDTMWTSSYNNHTFHFYNRENMDAFNRNPEQYVHADGRIRRERYADTGRSVERDPESSTPNAPKSPNK